MMEVGEAFFVRVLEADGAVCDIRVMGIDSKMSARANLVQPTERAVVGRQGGQRRYIQGTRVRYVLELIYHFYPAIRLIMDLHLGLVTSRW